nr:HEAT repeat domain-containing protein [Planctomycetota bacterium]
MPVRALLAVFALLIWSAALHGADNALALRKGDRIAIIGSAVADRMQHDAWFESLIYRAYPDLDLTVRTLAVPCDEVVTRLRTETGATRDAWLARLDSTVVLAFYGFNESFAGPAGLPQFTQDLHDFIAAIRAAHGSAGQATRLVLIASTAAEDLHDANLAAPGPLNANLAAYAAAMAAVAKADGVPFVDLFATSQQLYGAAAHPLTFNGIHLTETGDEALAPALFQGVFGVPPPLPSAALETLRAAVVDKNETWFHRYRTVDSYNIYGDRSRIGYESGPGGPKLTNAQVMEPEMAVRDALTVKRDRRIWAVAQGGDLALDEAGLPEVPVVKTNLPGSGPDGTHPYLGAEAAIAHMTLAKGCKANLFASEEQFPELVKPVQMAWDTRGRLWVAVWPNYPERTPTSTVGDKILILEDTDGDGKADKVTTFIEGLNCPTGFQFHKDGILLMQSPDLWFVRDTDGDGKADWKERVLMGLDAADSHHETNSMVVDQGGAMYLSDGWFMRTQIETAQGPVRNVDAAIYRYEPLSQRFERYVPYDFANPHGRVFDGWGTDIITDGTGNENFFAPAFSGHIDYPGRHPRMQQFWNRPSRPCAGTCILSSRHFPEEFQGNFLDCNVIGMQGVFRARVREEGSGLAGDTLENLVSSDDRTFRPSGVNVGPDGAVYVMDWSNAIVGHLQHHLRDPNRDHVHGRIYRITYDGRPLLAPARIADQPVAALLDLLKEPEDNVRARAQLELGKRDPATVLAAVDAWATKLDPAAAGFARNQLYALWTHQWFNAVDLPLLRRLLRAPDHHVRAAATRVLCYWRDRVPEVLALLRVQAEDEHPRVRLEAVRACSFLRQWEAGDVALLALKRPHDYYVDY